MLTRLEMRICDLLRFYPYYFEDKEFSLKNKNLDKCLKRFKSTIDQEIQISE